MFADIVDFTAMCRVVEPDAVMWILNELYTAFDNLLEEHGVYKARCRPGQGCKGVGWGGKRT